SKEMGLLQTNLAPLDTQIKNFAGAAAAQDESRSNDAFRSDIASFTFIHLLITSITCGSIIHSTFQFYNGVYLLAKGKRWIFGNIKCEVHDEWTYGQL
ncbi:hypothetical protein ACJX0J_037177, partial [Zea mays]